MLKSTSPRRRPLQHASLFLLGLLIVALPGLAFAQIADSLYGPRGVSPMAVRQGALGSCYFHSSIAAIAKASPATLRNAIGGDARDGYRVHFLSGPDELVYPRDIEFARTHNYDRSEGEWVAVLMRGYAQRALRQGMADTIQRSTLIPIFAKPLALSSVQQSGPLLLAYDRAVRAVVSQDGQMDKASFEAQLAKEIGSLGVPTAQAQVLGALLDHGGLYEAIAKTVRENGEVFGAYRSLGQGGIPASVLEAFLGAPHTGPIPDSSFDEELRSLHAGRTAMVAGTKSSIPSFQLNVPDWYVPGHAYTLLDYDEPSQTVTLRNPWGSRPGPDGVFRLPLSGFEQAYETYSYSAGSQ